MVGFQRAFKCGAKGRQHYRILAAKSTGDLVDVMQLVRNAPGLEVFSLAR